MLQGGQVYVTESLGLNQAANVLTTEQQVIDELAIEANASITATASIDQPTVMQHLTQKWQDVLFENLRNLRRQNKLCDVSLITKNSRGDDTTFMAHSIILISASPYLAEELDKGGINESAVGLNMAHVPETGIGPVLDLLYGTIVTIRDEDHLQSVRHAASLLGILNIHNFLMTVDGSNPSKYPIRMQNHKVLSYGARRGILDSSMTVSKFTQTEKASSGADLLMEEYVYHKKQDLNVEINCPYCFLPFTNKIFYLSHLSRVHPTSKGEFWFNCDVCREVFLSCSQYKQHMSTVHPADNPSPNEKDSKVGSFLCQSCGKIFLSNSKLKAHMRTHKSSDLKPSSCPACDLTLPSKDAVKEHLASVHSNRNDKICELCSVSFATKKMLKKHRKEAHSPSLSSANQCSECDLAFDSVDALNEHMNDMHKPDQDVSPQKRIVQNVRSAKQIKKRVNRNPLAQKAAPTKKRAVNKVASTALKSGHQAKSSNVALQNKYLCGWCCNESFTNVSLLKIHQESCVEKPPVHPTPAQRKSPEPTTRTFQIQLSSQVSTPDVPITIELPEGMELPPEIILPSEDFQVVDADPDSQY